MFLKVVTFLVLFTLGWCTTSIGQPTNYIDTYSEIAIREMHRSGIPASITLAQGILESSWGNGSLALKANNHFGIKCKSYWEGPTFYIQDDDYENGKLIKSCFRSYDNADDSFIDHTDFLMNNERYAVLFTYEKSDYKKWAHGLKRCGYATDKNYAYKLIQNIKKYQLDRFDEVEAEPVFTEVTDYTELDVISPGPIPIRNENITSIDVIDIPKAFALPEDYKRGAGLSFFEKTGEEKMIRKSPTILWNSKK